MSANDPDETETKLNQIAELGDTSRNSLDVTIYRSMAEHLLSEDEVAEFRAKMIDEVHEQTVVDADNEQAVQDAVDAELGGPTETDLAAGNSGLTGGGGASKKDLLAAAQNGSTSNELIALSRSARGDPLGDLADDFGDEAFAPDASSTVREIHKAATDAERRRDREELHAANAPEGEPDPEDFPVGVDDPLASAETSGTGKEKIITDLVENDPQVGEGDRKELEAMSLPHLREFAGEAGGDSLDAYGTGVQ
jgi:hypothetical protein